MALLSSFNLESDGSDDQPICTVLAGCNGSGKSSQYGAIRAPGRFINADVTARELNPRAPERASIAAGRSVLHDLDQAIAKRDETTLSGRQPITLMERAKATGFQVGFVFVTLRDVELHIRRVAQRVAEGGHNIEENVIRRRYETSMLHIVAGLRLADSSTI